MKKAAAIPASGIVRSATLRWMRSRVGLVVCAVAVLALRMWYLWYRTLAITTERAPRRTGVFAAETDES